MKNTDGGMLVSVNMAGFSKQLNESNTPLMSIFHVFKIVYQIVQSISFDNEISLLSPLFRTKI